MRVALAAKQITNAVNAPNAAAQELHALAMCSALPMNNGIKGY